MAEMGSKGSKALKFPRRIIKLGNPEPLVIEEFPSALVSGKAVHEALVNHAKANPGEILAAEWLGPLGWIRFLTMGPAPVVSAQTPEPLPEAKPKKEPKGKKKP